MTDRPPRPEFRSSRLPTASQSSGRALMRRRDAVAAPLRWAPACRDATVQQLLDNSLRSACALIGARGGFIVVLRDHHHLDIAATHALSAVAVLDATLGLAAPALHRALLEAQHSTHAEAPNVIGLAMSIDVQTRGALCLLHEPGARTLSELDREILDALAGQAALALAAGSQQLALTRLRSHLAPGHH